MIYYIDGYNFLFTQGREQDPFECAREEVLEYFSEKISDQKLIVTFDAHNSHGQFSRTFYKNIEVIYSAHDQTADDFLIDQVRFSKKPDDITVVSNDKKLIKEIKTFRAHGLSFERFFQKLNKKKTPPSEKPNPGGFGSHQMAEYLKKFKF
ncbi:MAG: hypothetical protein S4CHLAM6_05190 [Chlamydiae bacterium]|nr:hypothetical protein [Chlamydiota bacterium]